MPIPIEMAPIIAVTKFKENPAKFIMPYNHATTSPIGITVTIAYLKERIVIINSKVAAMIAIGKDV